MSSIPHASGIYQIRCIPNGRIYIGSSSDIYHRYHEHWSKLRLGKHANPPLQCAWNKYGADAFEFTVVELVLECCLLEREQYWLDRLKPFKRAGFNVATVAGSFRGYKFSPESLARRSAALKGHPVSAETRQKQSERAKARLVHPRRSPMRPEEKERIGALNRGRKLSPETRAKIGQSQIGRIIPQSTREAVRKASQKTYSGFVAPDGTVYRNIINLEAFCRDHGLKKAHMYAVHSGERKTHHGWRKADEA